MSETLQAEQKVFLVVAEDSEGFDTSLRTAAALANDHKGRVGIFYAASDAEFQQWGGIQDKIRDEVRQNAEKFVWSIAKKVQNFHDKMPVIYIEMGDNLDMLLKTINSDENISMLIMPVGCNKDSNAYAQKIIVKSKIPVLIVDTAMDIDKITKIFKG